MDVLVKSFVELLCNFLKYNELCFCFLNINNSCECTFLYSIDSIYTESPCLFKPIIYVYRFYNTLRILFVKIFVLLTVVHYPLPSDVSNACYSSTLLVDLNHIFSETFRLVEFFQEFTFRLRSEMNSLHLNRPCRQLTSQHYRFQFRTIIVFNLELVLKLNILNEVRFENVLNSKLV